MSQPAAAEPTVTPEGFTPQAQPQDPTTFEPTSFGDPEPTSVEPAPEPSPDPVQASDPALTPDPDPDPAPATVADPDPGFGDDIFAPIETPEDTPNPTLPAEPEPTAPDSEATPQTMRDQIVAANQRAKEAQDRLDALQAEYEQTQEKLNQASESQKLLEAAAASANPATHPDVVAITGPMDQEWENYTIAMGPNGTKLRNNSQELFQGWQNVLQAHGTDEYDQKYSEYSDLIRSSFEGEDSRGIIQMVNKCVQTMTKAQAKMEEIQKNGDEYAYQSQVQQHSQLREAYEKEEKTFLTPSEVEAENPYHPKMIFKRMAGENPQVEQRMKSVLGFVRQATLPPAPVNRKELVGLPEAEAEAKIAEGNLAHQNAAMQRDRILAQGIMALTVLPQLAKELDRMKAVGDRAVAAKPAAPAAEPGQNGDEEPDSPLDPTGFKPENPHLQGLR